MDNVSLCFLLSIALKTIIQSLRSRLSYHPEFRNQIHSNQEDSQAIFDCNRIQGEIDCFSNSVSGQVVPLEDMRTLNSEKGDQVNCNSTSNDHSPCSNHDVSARDDVFRNLAPLEGTGFSAEEISPHNGTKGNDSSAMITSEKCHPEQIAETDKVCNKEISLSSHQVSKCAASCSEADVNVDGAYKMNSREDKTYSNAPNANSEVLECRLHKTIRS
ncbi:hypothetical protein CRYUN_Cryun12cG0191900 [Craigia yunnanensis]